MLATSLVPGNKLGKFITDIYSIMRSLTARMPPLKTKPRLLDTERKEHGNQKLPEFLLTCYGKHLADHPQGKVSALPSTVGSVTSLTDRMWSHRPHASPVRALILAVLRDPSVRPSNEDSSARTGGTCSVTDCPSRQRRLRCSSWLPSVFRAQA